MNRTEEISQVVKQLLAATAPAQIGAVYEKLVGYDCHAEDLTRPLEELRGLALGVIREVCRGSDPVLALRTVGLPGFMQEFSWADWTPEVAQLLTRGWADTSWHNNTCPSFNSPENDLRIWIEHSDPALRENPHRYEVHTEHEDSTEVLLQTEDWNEVCRFLQQCLDDKQALDDAVEAAVNAGSKAIQDYLRISTGDFAGLFFSGDAADPIREVLARYLKDQRADEQRTKDSGFVPL